MSAGDGLSPQIGVELAELGLVAVVYITCAPMLLGPAHHLARAVVLALRAPLRRCFRPVLRWRPVRRLRGFGTLAKVEAALQHFHIPLNDRTALRNKLLEHELLYAVSLGILTPLPVCLLWVLHRDLSQLRDPSAAQAAQGLAVVVTALLLAILAILGGMIRFASPRIELLCIKALCRTLISAHRVSIGHWRATRRSLSNKAEEVGKFLESSARSSAKVWRRPDSVAYAERVHAAIRNKEREFDVVGDAAVDDLAATLARILQGLCAETPLSLLEPADLPERPAAPEPSNRRVAALLLLGQLLVTVVSWGSAALGAPDAVTTSVVMTIGLIPLCLWGGAGLVRAQRLVQIFTGSGSADSQDDSASASSSPSGSSGSTPTS